MKYDVGQILFLISDTNKVVPIQVVEEVVRTTLDGKEKTYIIQFPDKKRSQSDIRKIKGRLFNSDIEVQEFMLDNTRKAIETMIEQAKEISFNVFNVSIKESSDLLSFVSTPEVNEEKKEDNNEKVQQPADDGIIRVDLGNGKFGKIKANEYNNAGAPK